MKENGYGGRVLWDIEGMGGENEVGNVGIMGVGSMESSHSRMHE